MNTTSVLVAAGVFVCAADATYAQQAPVDAARTEKVLGVQEPANVPCEGVDRTIHPQRIEPLKPILAKQLQAQDLKGTKPTVEVVDLFALGKWQILHVKTGVSDDGFLFYSGDPMTHDYVTVWGGSAAPDEETQIQDWAVKNAKGIPDRLASCFAWYVTKAQRL